MRRKRAKKEDNSRENCWSKGVFAYLEGRRFLSSKKGEVIIKSPRFSFLFSHQDKYKVEQIFINTHLFSSFLFIFFFFLFYYYTRYYATLFKKHHIQLTNFYLRKVNRIYSACTKVFNGKIGNFHSKQARDEKATRRISTISTSPPILSRNVAYCVRSANWIVGGNRRKGCLHVCGPILSSICMSLFTAGPISRGAGKADPASRAAISGCVFLRRSRFESKVCWARDEFYARVTLCRNLWREF